MDDFAGGRGDSDSPVDAFEKQFYELLQRYQDTVEDNPARVSALLIEYVDSLRILYDLDLDGGHVSDELMGVVFDGVDGEQVGWLNAPRTGPYHDIDPEAFTERSDVPVEITGTPEDGNITFEFHEEADLDE